MVKSRKGEEEDVTLDGFGRPLPAVTLVDGRGGEVLVRDAAALSNLHYGQGMGFAEDGMTYSKALARMLGEEAPQVLVEVPAVGDFSWPAPPDQAVEEDQTDSRKKSDAKSD